MSRYLPFKNVNGTCSVAICDRCRMKMYLGDLQSDGDTPGLRVCKDCSDQIDPWKLPTRRSERLSVPHPRPDEELV